MDLSHKFSIGFQNIQGMHNSSGCKINEIKEKLSDDIEILAETWGCDCNVSFENYTPHFVSPQKHLGVKKGRKSGGFMVLIKNYLSKDIKIHKTSNNFVWIEVNKKFMKNLQNNFFIVGTYINDITSTYYDDKIFQELHNDILNFGSANTPILFMGDFNGRTGNTDDSYKESAQLENLIPTPNTFINIPKRRNCDDVLNSHGKKIIDFCHTFDFKILNGRTTGDLIGNFTHLNVNNGASTIDYSLCNQHLYQCVDDFIVLPLMGMSDHSKISTIFKSNIKNIENIQDNYKWNPLRTKYKWDNQRKNIFSETLKSSLNEIEDITQRLDAGLINSTGEKIQDLYLKVANTTLDSKKIRKNWKRRNKSKKWFDQECRAKKQEVHKVGKQKHENPHENLLRIKYHEKLKEFKKRCRSKRFIFWQDKFQEIEASLNDSKDFWKKWKNASEIDISQRDTQITGNQWFSHFSNLHSEKSADKLGNINTKTKMGHELNEPFTKKEFMTVIKNLKNDKAAGFDSILNEMLKNSPPVVLNLIHRFINLCLLKSLVPQSWCMELITPIFKDGDLNDPNNYRGICISSSFLKIICTLLNNRIQSYCTKHNVINKNQIGFKSKHRTSDHLLTLKTVVKKYVTIGKKKLFTCFIDFKKAFDSVWHQGMFHKINKIGIFGKSLELIKNIYKKTKCAVKVNDHTTEFFNYTKGVRQGCPLSPILFNIYVNDIFDLINNIDEPDVYLDKEHKINALMYADDLILISETQEGLQKQIDKLSDFCEERKLDVNIKKTKIMIFNRGNKLLKTEFRIKNSVLENVKSFKYLGFTISAKNCSFTPTVEDLSTKANRAVFALNNKIKLSMLPTRLAIKIFNSQIAPILLYGSEIWGPYMDYDYATWDKDKTERVHTQYLKRILGCNFHTSNNMVRAEVGARPLILQILKRVISYINSVKKRKFSTVNTAFEFESKNDINPNISTYIDKFNLIEGNLIDVKKHKLNKICQDNYDRYWWGVVNDSPKAISFVMFKRSVCLEKYLHQVKNLKNKKALSRFRLSNHSLMIEIGRHLRPRLERNERKCPICKDEVENEIHFLTKCPLYTDERDILFQVCRQNCIHFDALSYDEQKFIFIMTNENPDITRSLAKFICNSFEIRKEAIS